MKRVAIATTALVLLGGFTYGARDLSKEDVVSLQEQTFAEKGEYEQIKPDDRKAGRKLAPNIRVDVYDGANGKGYTVTEITDTQVIITDYGKEGRSIIYDKPRSATSTP